MTLAELVRRQKQKSENAPDRTFDWRLRRDKWISELENVFATIKDWLCRGGVPQEAFTSFPVEIHEETLGRYVVDGFKVRIGNSLVTFKPIAGVLVGACGRVDIYSDQPGTQQVKLVADLCVDDPSRGDTQLPAEQQWTWLFYPGIAGDGGFVLNEEGLTRALAIVLGESD